MARHAKKKEKRNTERMSIITTCRAWKVLFQGKENKKSLINWKGKRKKSEEKGAAGISSIDKTNDN